MVCRHVNSKTKHILARKSQFKLYQIRDNNKKDRNCEKRGPHEQGMGPNERTRWLPKKRLTRAQSEPLFVSDGEVTS